MRIRKPVKIQKWLFVKQLFLYTRGILLNYPKNWRDCFKILFKISASKFEVPVEVLKFYPVESHKYNSFLAESMNSIKNLSKITYETKIVLEFHCISLQQPLSLTHHVRITSGNLS